MSLSSDQIMKQSQAAYGQWCEQWREQAKVHSTYEMKSLEDFRNIGVGKAILLVANGYSLEKNIDVIKKNQDKVDILVCDKALGHLIKHGIKPTYVLVCDANVDYEKYMKPYEDELKDVILFANVCGNPKWSKKDKWKDIYFFVNEDVLKSEVEFSKISGCKNFIPAATNVSNCQVVFVTQSDNRGRSNHFGYDKILMVGFDYSWGSDTNYYAFDKTGDGKANYMRHIYCLNLDGRECYTSNNLLFSSKWLEQYVGTFKLPVVQCDKSSIFSGWKIGKLEEQMNYSFRPKDKDIVNNAMVKVKKLEEDLKKFKNVINSIGVDHYYAMMETI